MELEIKGFLQFCRFLSKHPKRIVDNQDLASLLDFCFDAVMKCDCSTGKAEKMQHYEQLFEEKFKAFYPKVSADLGFILDERNNFSDVFISFPLSGEKIKVK